jgi:hypothetical protein
LGRVILKMTKYFVHKYVEFYELFRLVVKPHDPHPYNLEFSQNNPPRRGFHHLQLKEPIHLAKWPIKSDSPSPSVDVSVDVDVIVRYEQGEIQHAKSAVYVTYFRRDSRTCTATAFENLRFDFHPETGEADHPILHAHVFSDGKPNSFPIQLKNFAINWDSLHGRLNSLRLPIPNMTLPSVLCCLVACHLGADTLRALLDKTEKQRKSFPSLAISQEQLGLFLHNSFAGSQWFERPPH